MGLEREEREIKIKERYYGVPTCGYYATCLIHIIDASHLRDRDDFPKFSKDKSRHRELVKQLARADEDRKQWSWK